MSIPIPTECPSEFELRISLIQVKKLKYSKFMRFLFRKVKEWQPKYREPVINYNNLILQLKIKIKAV